MPFQQEQKERARRQFPEECKPQNSVIIQPDQKLQRRTSNPNNKDALSNGLFDQSERGIHSTGTVDERSDVLVEYQKTLEHADLDPSPYSAGQSGERRVDDEPEPAANRRGSESSRGRGRESSGFGQPKGMKDKTDNFEESAVLKQPKMKRVISIPSANDDEDDEEDDDERDKDSEENRRERVAVDDYRQISPLNDRPSKEVGDQSPRRSPKPIESSFKPTAGGGDLAGTLDMLDSSLGSVDSASLPDMSPVRSAIAERSSRDRSANGQSGGSPIPKSEDKTSSRGLHKKGEPREGAMGVKKTATTASPPAKEKAKPQEFGRLGRVKSEEDDDEDDIFGREEKNNAIVKEEANMAYQKMMSTMKSESSTSRAVNTNKALDSSSEDELENAIQKAVLGSKAKKDEVSSPPLKSLSPRSPPVVSSGSKSQSSASGSPVRSAAQSVPAKKQQPPPPQQQQQQSKTRYQPKKPTTNFGMFSVSAASSSGNRPPHLRKAGSDSDLDDASSDGDRKKISARKFVPKDSDDDYDFYG